MHCLCRPETSSYNNTFSQTKKLAERKQKNDTVCGPGSDTTPTKHGPMPYSPVARLKNLKLVILACPT